MTAQRSPRGGLRYLPVVWRLPLFLLHMVVGLPLALLSFNRAGRRIRVGDTSLNEFMIRWWSRNLCRTFGVRVVQRGTLPAPPVLVVANHSSWLDILALSSLGHLRFVAKAEIARWPLIGWIATVSGVIFHARGSSDSLADVAATLVTALKSRHSAAIFPEGRVNDGTGVGRFHARLFRAAVETGCLIQPVSIRYVRAGEVNIETSYRNAESTATNMLRLWLAPGCRAQVSVLAAIQPADEGRRELAEQARDRITAEYGSEID